MKEYLAKSNPRETIQEHTDHLVDNYEILKSLYPSINVNWGMLYLSVLTHDLGKINEKFQSKLNGKQVKGEIPHGVLSLPFIDYKELEKQGYEEEDIKVLFHSVGYHHEREFNFEKEELDEEISFLEKETPYFQYDKIPEIKIQKKIEPVYFKKSDRIYMDEDERLFFKYVITKGLLNRLDYAASAHIPVEHKNDFLLDNMEELSYQWNDLQEYMLENTDENVIIVAQTGMGKTEAGLLWIGNNKGFFTLPLKTAINAMFDRVVKIVGNPSKDKVGLLHSDTYEEYMKREEKEIEDYFNRTKQLSLPVTICTLDQLFDLVYRYPGFEQKLATLSYSKVVIDEIQMYSPDLLAYLIVGLSYITKVGGKFAILTATLPGIVIDLLKKQKVQFQMPEKPFIDNNLKRHSVKSFDEKINKDIILEQYKSNKVLVICNTVKKAQEIYEELEEMVERNQLNLFHSKFTKRDRREKESDILKFGQKETQECGIWITTQVVEASLDIDFDILITELSDLNGLFQRMGRCYRKRNYERIGYNCYVFYGKGTSGVGTVVDKDVFKFSKNALKEIDGFITEEDKVALIEEIYSTKNLKKTKYYKNIIKTIGYVKSFNDFELTKTESRDRFRNIKSWNIIPCIVYEKNKETLKELLSIVWDFKNYNKESRYQAKSKILEYVISISIYDYDRRRVVDSIDLSKYEKIYIYKCNYSKGIGFQKVEEEDKEEYGSGNIL